MTMPRVEGVAHATSGAEDCGQVWQAPYLILGWV